VKITTREKKFLITGAAVCAVSLIVYLAILFVPSREELANEVRSSKTMLLREKEILDQEENYKVRVEEYRKRLQADLAGLLPGDNPNVAAAELQKVLTDLAERNGVEIVRKDIQKEKKVQDNLIKVSVRIETNCVPDELVQFLTAIENYEKFLTLDLLLVNSIRMQKRYEIRPSITVSGYIMAGESKPETQRGSP